jgi:hypothetical protein
MWNFIFGLTLGAAFAAAGVLAAVRNPSMREAIGIIEPQAPLVCPRLPELPPATTPQLSPPAAAAGAQDLQFLFDRRRLMTQPVPPGRAP